MNAKQYTIQKAIIMNELGCEIGEGFNWVIPSIEMSIKESLRQLREMSLEQDGVKAEVEWENNVISVYDYSQHIEVPIELWRKVNKLIEIK